MQSRMEASRRFEMYNKGHVPDIIEIDAVDTLYEVKCWTPIRKFQALGHGSTKKGGAVSTNEGSHIAFGGTAESARHLTLGCKQRGTADQAPFDHATGVGYVAGHAGTQGTTPTPSPRAGRSSSSSSRPPALFTPTRSGCCTGGTPKRASRGA